MCFGGGKDKLYFWGGGGGGLFWGEGGREGSEFWGRTDSTQKVSSPPPPKTHASAPMPRYPTFPDDFDVLSVLIEQMALPVEGSCMLAATCKELGALVPTALKEFSGQLDLWSNDVGRFRHMQKHCPKVKTVCVKQYRFYEVCVSDQLELINRLPQLKHLTSLFMANVGLCFNAALLISSVLEYLSVLDVSCNTIGIKGKALLVQMSHMKDLNVDHDRSCYLLWTRGLDVEMSRTLQALRLSGLIDMNRNWSVESSCAMLRRVGALRHLRELHLSCSIRSGSILASSALEHLVALPLERLAVAKNTLVDLDAVTLGRIQTLHDLDVNWNNFTLGGLQAICDLERLTSLHVARLYSSGPRNLDAILSSLSLTELDMSYNVFHPDGGSRYVEMPILLERSFDVPAHVSVTVETLNVSYCDLGQVDFTPLFAFPNLTSLDVSSNFFGNRGAGMIAALKNLRTLKCANCSVPDGDVRILSTMPLITLNIDYHSCRFPSMEGMQLSPISSLQHLSMKDSPFPGLFGLPARRSDVMFPVDWVTSMCKLVVLGIDSTSAELSHIAAIARLLPLLEKLSMSQLRCTDRRIRPGEDTEGDRMAFEVLKMASLRELDISLNNVRNARKRLNECKWLTRCVC